MKNLLIFSAVVLSMLYLFTSGSQSLSDAKTTDPDEQALQDAGYYDDPNPPGHSAPSAPPRHSTLQSRALPERLVSFTCDLNRSDTRARLVAELGEPATEIESTPTLLSWRHEDWQVDAMLDDQGKMNFVSAGGASLVGLAGDTTSSSPDIPNLKADRSTFSQVEQLLGPGVLTKVSWKAGIPVASSVLKNNPSLDYMTSDHCEHLYTWMVPGRERPLTLAFRNDHLVTSLLAGFSS